MVTEEFGIPIHQNRNVFAVTSLEGRVAVDVDDLDGKTRSHVLPQRDEHLVAEPAVAAAVQGVARAPIALRRQLRTRANRAHRRPLRVRTGCSRRGVRRASGWW